MAARTGVHAAVLSNDDLSGTQNKAANDSLNSSRPSSCASFFSAHLPSSRKCSSRSLPTVVAESKAKPPGIATSVDNNCRGRNNSYPTHTTLDPSKQKAAPRTATQALQVHISIELDQIQPRHRFPQVSEINKSILDPKINDSRSTIEDFHIQQPPWSHHTTNFPANPKRQRALKQASDRVAVTSASTSALDPIWGRRWVDRQEHRS